MARPTDPAALAALRARQAAASRAYRARQKVARAASTPYANRHGGGIVQAAREQAEQLRRTRATLLSQLPDVRNPRANIRPNMETGRAEGPERKTKKGQLSRAADIRANSNATRVELIGKRRKADLRTELTTGPIAGKLRDELSPYDLMRLSDLLARIARGSAQSIGILFDHVGGQKLYSAAIERLLYAASREEGFDILETLTEYAESAAREYAPSRIGRLRI